MSHEEYKELLAADVLDLLSGAEREQLAAHMNDCRECEAEMRELRDAAALLALTVPAIAPPIELHARVLQSIRPNISLDGQTREADQGMAIERDEPSAKILPLPLKNPRGEQAFISKRSAFAFGALAAAIILALLIPLALLWKRNNDLRAELARQANNLQTTQTELARASERLRETQAGLTGERERPEPTASPEVSNTNVPPANGDQGTQIVRSPNRDDARSAEFTRLLNRSRELQTQLEQFSTRNNELQAELARVSQSRSEAQTQLAALTNQNAQLQRELARLTERTAELQTQIASYSTRNSELQTEITRLSKRNNDLQTELARREAEPSPLAAPDTRAVTLAGTKAARGARGNLTYDNRTGGITLYAYNLPPAPPGKAYQLWVIAGGKPISGGVFTTDEAGRATLRGQVPAGGRKPSAFAVTLEPEGGSIKPTGNKYLLGSVS
ncbi:MAG: anti-sigma factor [Pyrinomonadaceae bacterium]|nr:anti-sigma factor [Pyrinomonadaceae bacterium]